MTHGLPAYIWLLVLKELELSFALKPLLNVALAGKFMACDALKSLYRYYNGLAIRAFQ